MRVQNVAIGPNMNQLDKKTKVACPELLASIGARYSRSNEGLDEIYKKVDEKNIEKSIDDIFKFIDYGHLSIADMVPVSMFIDDVSLWAAYYIFSICPTASGQESSTRYIDFSKGKSIKDVLIDEKYLNKDYSYYERLLNDYDNCLKFWENHLDQNPGLLSIKAGTKELAAKRIKRNYAFDRARYLLPMACKTNLMLIQSARDWAKLIKTLLSSKYKEFQDLGEKMREQLEIASPRMVRHASYSDHSRKLEENSLAESSQLTGENIEIEKQLQDTSFLEIHGKVGDLDISDRETRYSGFSDGVRSVSVRFGWEKIAIAELRDLNRHRTGEKIVDLAPKGFYCAWDQLGPVDNDFELMGLYDYCIDQSSSVLSDYNNLNQDFIYDCTLGYEFTFSHLTTLNHLVYEIELRTGSGCHFNYKRHLNEVREKLEKLVPNLENKFIIS